MTAAVTASDSNMGVYHSINKDSYDDKNTRFKVGCFTVPTATTSSDTCAIDLEESFGIKRFMGIRAFQHYPTENSIIQEESVASESATAVVNNTLTISINGTASACKRFYVIYGV